MFRLNKIKKRIDKFSEICYTLDTVKKGEQNMYEFTFRNMITGERIILFGKSCDSTLRAAGHDPMEWACEHIYDTFEEKRVW